MNEHYIANKEDIEVDGDNFLVLVKESIFGNTYVLIPIDIINEKLKGEI